jgi:hypothetical protein
MADLALGLNRARTGIYSPAQPINVDRPTDPVQQAELDAANLARAREVSGDFSSGVNTGARNLSAGARAYLGQVAKTVGADEYGQEVIDNAAQDYADNAELGPRVTSLRDINNASDLGSFASQAAGQGVTSLLPQVGLALATRGRSLVPGAAIMAPSTAGDALMRINSDPATARLSDAKKLAIISGEGAASAALESIVPTAIGRNITGAATAVTKPTVKTAVRDAVGQLSTEAATEAAQTALGQQVQGTLNPDRDTSTDLADLADSAASGFFGAGPVVAGGKAAELTLGAPAKAVSAATDSAEVLKDKLNDGINILSKPQRAPAGIDPDQWLTDDDNKRNTVATTLAETYVKAADTSARMKQAAQEYLQSGRAEDDWQNLAQAAKTDQRIQSIKAGATEFLDNVGTRIKAGVDQAKINVAEARASRNNEQDTVDQFDYVLADDLFNYTGVDDISEVGQDLTDVATGMRAWATNGFKIGGEVRVPKALYKIFADPVQAITATHDLMVKQGLIEPNKAALDEALGLVAANENANVSVSQIVAENLVPTARAEFGVASPNDESLLGQHLVEMLATGKVDEGLMTRLFGPNKEAVLESVNKQINRPKNILDRGETSTRPDDDANSLDGFDQTIEEADTSVKYHGPFTNTEGALNKAQQVEDDLRTAKGQATSRVGIVDYLREQHRGGDPMALVAAVSEAVDKYKKLLVTPEDRANPDKAINRLVTYIRAEDAGDKSEPGQIDGSELNTLTGKGANNKWGVPTGQDNKYGTNQYGRVYFERESINKETGEIETMVFATSAGKLIARGRQARTKDTIADGSGTLSLVANLNAGIAAMLSAKNDDGRRATSGRVGFLSDPKGKIQWATGKGAKLPADLALPGGLTVGDRSKAQYAKINTENAKELKAWLTKAEERDNDFELGKIKQATKALNSKDPEAINKALADIVDDWREPSNKAREIAVVRETVITGKATDSETGRTSYATKTSARHLSEGEERAESEAVKENNTPRLFNDDGTPLDPRTATKPTEDQIQAKEKLAKQVDYLKNLLNKGLPAFSAALTKLNDGQKNAMREVLGQLDRAKTNDNPIWSGKPPTDLTQFGNRVRVALNLLGTTKSTRSNKQTTKPEALSADEQKKIRDDVLTRLGPDIRVEFVKEILDSNDKTAKAISGQWTEGLIRISLGASDPAGVGAHESMHEFFNRLLKSDLRDAQKVKDILTRAASSKLVLRQVERLLAGQASALNQLKESNPDHMEERLAYMYQFYTAGLIKLGPETEGVFTKVYNFIRKTLGALNDLEKTDQILQAFSRGEAQTADAAAKVLAENVEHRARKAKAALKFLDPVIKRTARFTMSAEASLMTSDNVHLKEILTTFKNPTGLGVQQSIMEARSMKQAQFTNKLDAVLEGKEQADIDIAIKHLQSGKGIPPLDQTAKEIYDGVRNLLDDMEVYLRDAGVQRFNEKTNKWEDFGHIKNYYPRAYDINAISKDPEGFAKALLATHSKELEAVAKKANKELADPDLVVDGTYASALAKADGRTDPITADDVATAIVSRIINSNGQPELSESERSIGYSPYAQAINQRTLNWIDTSKLSDWMNNDLINVMTSYISQGTRRAESARRFGNNSERLQDKVEQAFQLEIDKAMAEAKGKGKPITKEEATEQAVKVMAGPRKDIMALEGTIGYDINPKLQRLQGTALVYQNFRILGLSLFSQMIDPLGIMVRGGTMKDAFGTYVRGLKEVKASWTGKKLDDEATKIAELIGTVDSGGFLANFGDAYGSVFLHDKARRWNEALFKYNGMEGFNRATRVQATMAAIDFIKRQKTDPTHNSARYLDELVLSPQDIVIDKNGDLDYTNAKIQVAVKRWVDQAILRPNAAQRPAWMSDPHFALFSHMKQFSYAFHDVILKRAWLEAKNHGELGPVGILLAGFIPMMVAADTAKSVLLTGKTPYWMHQGLPEIVTHGAMRAGLLGISQPYADPVTNGHIASLGGPAFEQAVSIVVDPFEESVVNALPGASIAHTMSGPKVAN